MVLSDEQILAQNPWWSEQAWADSDRQLVRLAAQPMRLPTAFVDEIDLARAGVIPAQSST